jgi:hypothetical protein
MNDTALRDPRPLTDRLIEAGETWADLHAAASALEETADTVFAKVLAEHFDKPEWKARAMAKSDERYTEHIGKMVAARKAANRAKVRYDSGKAYVELTRSAEATKRAEMTLR